MPTSFFRLPLLWRAFALNAALLAVATVLLAVTPFTISAPIALVEAVVLGTALAVMLTLEFALLRSSFAPLRRLVQRMRTVDLLRPGERLPESGGAEVAEVAQLVRTFNEMLDRLEAERRESSRRVLAAQEAERERIARGLHDEVGQVLTGILLRLDDVAGADAAQREDDVASMKTTVRQALEEVRRIAYELRPAMLDQLGLVSALTELSAKFESASGVTVERHFDPDLPVLPKDAEIAIYRVAQESLTNVARHAHATRVELRLARGPRGVVLSVADDGQGFVERAELNGHGGLRGMRERAVLLGGALAVERAQLGGVEIRLEVPAGAG
jgi:two-component system sensor histidine kinase UhpB